MFETNEDKTAEKICNKKKRKEYLSQRNRCSELFC